MKKLLAIFFLILYMFSTTELHQLLKFPALVEHYIEHKDMSPDISVVDFLELHYNNHLENHPKNDDFENDKKLPFIIHSDIMSFCFVYPQPLNYEINYRQFTDDNDRKVPSIDDQFTDNTFFSTIWQPPKFC